MWWGPALGCPPSSRQWSIETTTARPMSSRYRRLDPERLITAKVEFVTTESQGIIRRSKDALPIRLQKTG